MAINPAIVSAGIKVLGGLFGKKPDIKTAADTIYESARGARKASKEFGFSPLTLLGLGAGVGAHEVGGSPPPLAGAAAVLGDYIDQNLTDEAKDRKEHNRLQNELLRLEVDRARTLAPVAPPSAVRAMGPAAFTGGADMAEGPADYWQPDRQGPKQPVMVFNALNGRWMSIKAPVAERLRITAGEAFIAEDVEALMGEVVGEAHTTGSAATGVVEGSGPIVDPPKPETKPKPKPKWKPRSTTAPIKQNLRY